MIRHFTCALLVLTVTVSSASAFPDKKAAKKTATDTLVNLNQKGTVLLDVKGKRVLLKTKVALRDGVLEMLICPKRTKEHESILVLDAKAFVVHTGLLAIGAKTGTPVKFQPKFQPPTGQEIDIFFSWKDKNGKLHRVNSQTWIRNSIRRYYIYTMKTLPAGLTLPPKDKTELRHDKLLGELFWFGHMTIKQRDDSLKLSKDAEFQKAIKQFYTRSQPRQMKAKWVFAGSGFEKIGNGGKKIYLAEQGSMICLANFSTSMIDISQKSSASQGNSLYAAYTKRIPPKGTEVTVELIPVFKKTAKKKP